MVETFKINGFNIGAFVQVIYSEVPDTLKIMEKLEGTCGPISEDFVSLYGVLTVLTKRGALWGYIKLLALNPLNWQKTVQETLGSLYHLSQKEYAQSGEDLGTLLKRLLSHSIIYAFFD